MNKKKNTGNNIPVFSKIVISLFVLIPVLWISAGNRTKLFESISPQKSKIRFANMLTETPKTNILTYEYFYNGGGVAIGDINNDGLDDIYFTGNMVPNKLYLNEGNFRFRDITEIAGVGGKAGWTTGVTMVDVNGDGFLDIYVCYSGKGEPDERRNLLYINNGDLTFSERAADYGLDDPAHSTQALFFDFDLDGDLDMYLLNHNVKVIHELEFLEARAQRDPHAGDKLFENRNGKFIDISEKAGISGNPLGFGLGIAAADINQDGYPDLYVSNDYIEPDYLYINNGDGTFTESLTTYLQHISHFSMGLDLSDFNNDGRIDIFTLDMLPEDNRRQKLLYGPENYEQYALMVINGFYHQNMRNMLHLNNGNGTFSEIGQLAGVSNTDWSWAAFFIDLDNDGWKDLYVTNGYYRDYTNRDFLKYKGDYYFKQARAGEKADTFHLVTSMSSTPISNYVFRNNQDLTFSNHAADWGLASPGFSNGAAFADLDNDGSVDLVVNHLNAPAGIYRNQLTSIDKSSHWIQFNLKGEGFNSYGIGSTLYVYTGENAQTFYQQPVRGFQSSVSSRIHVGTGKFNLIDSVKIIWPDLRVQVLHNLHSDQVVDLWQKEALTPKVTGNQQQKPVFTRVLSPIPFQHVEAGYNDFKRQPLLTHMFSNSGPVMAVADVNGNGLQDVFVGGAKGQASKLYLQVSTGMFIESQGFNDESEKNCNDADATFFDANGDGLPDLLVVSGGYHEYQQGDLQLKDRLYINCGGGKFEKSHESLPKLSFSSAVAAVADFNKDGHQDIFIGGRVVPGRFPEKPRSALLLNNGKGEFTDVTSEYSSELLEPGMINDAVWVDLNQDGWPDLMLAGDYMPVKIFINNEGKAFINQSNRYFETELFGLWSSIAVADFDNDGDPDFILGNFGKNSQIKATSQQPASLVYGDFDDNGSVDPILSFYIQGQSYPFVSRDEMLDQMYSLRSKFTNYTSYADAKLQDILTREQLRKSMTFKVTELSTMYLENRNGMLIPKDLPIQAQFAPVYAIQTLDFDGDGNMDIILAGNQSAIRLRLGIMDANFGQLYKGDGNGNFTFVEQSVSGLSFFGDVKSLKNVRVGKYNFLLAGINNTGIDAYVINP
ncbi:MAG: VCBS repeat-containing protein [Cyclobacteriaceae bacterium]|nr:VCBS repeat-containing protein [Cyclobacteriaceae bacterium]